MWSEARDVAPARITMRRFRLLAVVCLFVSSAAGAGASFESPLPANVRVPGVYLPVVETMWEKSPTFRRQCSRLALAPFLTVTLQAGSPGAVDARATTRIERKRDGTLHAAVQVDEREDPTELIAHELEHVIEQLDGVNLAALADRPVSGVYRTTSGGYDTIRAIRIGEKVAREVRSAAK